VVALLDVRAWKIKAKNRQSGMQHVEEAKARFGL
jgi:hypothetical protein